MARAPFFGWEHFCSRRLMLIRDKAERGKAPSKTRYRHSLISTKCPAIAAAAAIAGETR
jgi:hypothetical protein